MGLEGGNRIAELHGFWGVSVIAGINKSTDGILLATKVLGSLCDVFLTVSLASLEADCCKKVCHFEAVGERLVGCA